MKRILTRQSAVCATLVAAVLMLGGCANAQKKYQEFPFLGGPSGDTGSHQGSGDSSY